MSSREFKLGVLTPARGTDPGLAVAGSRAGGLGILDLEGLTAESALLMVQRVGAHPSLDFGVRLGVRDVRTPALADRVIREAPPSVRTIILALSGAAGSHDAHDALMETMRELRRRQVQVLASVSGADEADLAEAVGVDGLVAKGHEAGGWVGEETTFVLLQRLLARGRLPVWAHGGVGIHTVAACYAAGAAGVLLDAQLALLRESTLPAAVRAAIERMDGSETLCLGSELGARCRVYVRPRLRPVEELKELALTLEGDPEADRLEAWRSAVDDRAGWGEGHVWLLGQDAAFAGSFARRFGTVAASLTGLKDAVGAHCRAARQLRPLNQDAPLARSHGTRYPILQGPMTRVSDTAAFAEAVAGAGALPFLALALMRGDEVRPLLEDTRARLGERPWGVGILGFVPQELRQEQLEAVLAVRPPYALIAGGRPDQALSFEKSGIATYLHVPSPGLLRDVPRRRRDSLRLRGARVRRSRGASIEFRALGADDRTSC